MKPFDRKGNRLGMDKNDTPHPTLPPCSICGEDRRNANGVKRSQEPMVHEMFCLSQVVSNRVSGRGPGQNSQKHRLSSVLNVDMFSFL